MWQKRIVHEGLHAFRMVRGATEEEVETKARLQLALWAERWRRKQESEQVRAKQLSQKQNYDRQVDVDRRARSLAIERTKDAETTLAALDRLLPDALARPEKFDWERLKDRTTFSKAQPIPPQLKSLPNEPQRTDIAFAFFPAEINLSLVDWVVPGMRKRKYRNAQAVETQRRNAADQHFAQAHSEWEKLCAEINGQNASAQSIHTVTHADWQEEKQHFEEHQQQYNSDITDCGKQYANGQPKAVTRYCNEVLAHSEYPDSFPRDCLLSFDEASGMLILDFELPPQNAIPKRKQVRYVANRQEFQDVFLSEAEFRRVYEHVLYQVCFRTLHELFHADEINAITSIVFNGWVHTIDKATGADIHPCVLSVQVKKADFFRLNLAQVDLKTCFSVVTALTEFGQITLLARDVIASLLKWRVSVAGPALPAFFHRHQIPVGRPHHRRLHRHGAGRADVFPVSQGQDGHRHARRRRGLHVQRTRPGADRA